MAADEHERKYLVANDEWRNDVISSTTIAQAYLADFEGGVVRVRLIGEQGWLSIKARINALSAREFEYPIPKADAIEIMDLPGVSNVVVKTRHNVIGGWEVDEFSGALNGLIVAEIELDHPHQTFEPPVWLGREVTDDFRYRNRALAEHGIPTG